MTNGLSYLDHTSTWTLIGLDRMNFGEWMDHYTSVCKPAE